MGPDLTGNCTEASESGTFQWLYSSSFWPTSWNFILVMTRNMPTPPSSSHISSSSKLLKEKPFIQRVIIHQVTVWLTLRQWVVEKLQVFPPNVLLWQYQLFIIPLNYITGSDPVSAHLQPNYNQHVFFKRIWMDKKQMNKASRLRVYLSLIYH